MKWNVYYYNINLNKIDIFNIFDHSSFNKYVQKHLKECSTKEEFAERLKSELLYFFWSKAEWELIIETVDNRIYLLPWCGCKEPNKVQIDVTDDVNFDWKNFAKYHIGRRNKNKAKIDVYEQVTYRLEEFLNYVYESK